MYVIAYQQSSLKIIFFLMYVYIYSKIYIYINLFIYQVLELVYDLDVNVRKYAVKMFFDI